MTVALVLNIEIGRVSQQYHLIFDDDFSTIHSDGCFNQDVWNSFLSSNPLERHIDCIDGTPILDVNVTPPTSNDMNTDVQRLFDSVNPYTACYSSDSEPFPSDPLPTASSSSGSEPFPSDPLPTLPTPLEGDPSLSEGVSAAAEGDNVISSTPSPLTSSSEEETPANDDSSKTPLLRLRNEYLSSSSTARDESI